MKDKLILQQDENKSLSKNLDGLISKLNNKIEISSVLQENVVNKIKQTIISIADDNNYWQDIFNAKQTEENENDQFEDQKKQQKLIYESQFTKYYNLILQQAQQKNQKKQQNQKQSKQSNDTKKKLQDAAKQQGSGSPDEISLVVVSPDDFEFQNSNGQRFESKKSLQQLDSFLKKNINILQAAIQKGKKENAEGKANALREAMQFVQTSIFTIKVFAKQKNNINIKVLTDLVKGCESATWKYVAKQHKFGDRVKNKAEYQKLYFILIASLITYVAIKNRGKTGSAAQGTSQLDSAKNTSDFDKLSIEEIANLIEEKIKRADKDPKDKKYLESLLNNKKWRQERTPKYQAALKLLISRA